MSTNKVRIATRKSPLALWQAEHIKEQLLNWWPDLSVELVPMVTSGDKFLKDKLLEAGGKGLFVKELEEALLTHKADIAVHSTKDVPSFFPEGLCLPVICKRDNPYDALLSAQKTNLNSLPKNAIIGTSSLRRQSQLLAHRPDLQIKTLRGNIQTRMAKLASGEYDAIILAAAGLERMGLNDSISEILSTEVMLPTCGQGALSIECRKQDTGILKLIAPLADPITTLCVQTERAVNANLGGNCHVPLAVFCTPTEDQCLSLQARLLNVEGSAFLRFEGKAPLNAADSLVNRCMESLFAQGAKSFIEQG